MEILRLKTKADMETAMQQCAGSFFDQSKNDPAAISSLADKFYRNAIVYAAADGGNTAGFIAFYCNDPVTRQAYLSMIVVNGRYGGRGIGSELLGRMVRYCTAKQFDSIKLEVNNNNARAIAFYRKRGFVKCGYATDASEYYILQLKNQAPAATSYTSQGGKYDDRT